MIDSASKPSHSVRTSALAIISAVTLAVVVPFLGTSDSGIEQGEVLATVNGIPIYAADVRHMIRADLPRPGITRYLSPQAIAVQQVVDFHLLAEEALRRGLTSPESRSKLTMARSVQKVIEDELRRLRIFPAMFRTEAVRRYYEQHLYYFDPVTWIEIQGVSTENWATAQRFAARLQDAPPANLSRLLADFDHGTGPVVTPFHVRVAEDEEGGSPDLTRAALWIREPGEVTVFRRSDGTFAILQIVRVKTQPQVWSDDQESTVRNYLFHRLKERVVGSLTQTLARQAKIVMNEAAIQRLPGSTWPEYSETFTGAP